MLAGQNAEASTLELPSSGRSDAEVGTVTLLRVLAATILGTGNAIQNAIRVRPPPEPRTRPSKLPRALAEPLGRRLLLALAGRLV